MAYHPFISVFNRRVDCMEKQSKDAIQKCMIIGGREGYKRALDILGNTYGNKHVITEKIKSELCSTKNVRTPSDIRSLADEAANAVLILDAAALYPEIDTQRTISNVVQRLAVHFRTRWCEKAIAYKRKHDKYPDFKEFVSFLDIISQ